MYREISSICLDGAYIQQQLGLSQATQKATGEIDTSVTIQRILIFNVKCN